MINHKAVLKKTTSWLQGRVNHSLKTFGMGPKGDGHCVSIVVSLTCCVSHSSCLSLIASLSPIASVLLTVSDPLCLSLTLSRLPCRTDCALFELVVGYVVKLIGIDTIVEQAAKAHKNATIANRSDPARTQVSCVV